MNGRGLGGGDEGAGAGPQWNQDDSSTSSGASQEAEREWAENEQLTKEFLSIGGKQEDLNTVAWPLFRRAKALEQKIEAQAANGRLLIGALWVVVGCLAVAVIYALCKLP
jgi:hypothetical protein